MFKIALLCFQSAREREKERGRNLALRSEGARKRATWRTRHHRRCESAVNYERTCTHTKYMHIYTGRRETGRREPPLMRIKLT